MLCNVPPLQVKSAFDDWAHAPKLSKIVNHVTTSQFFQGLCKLNLGINASDASLLAEKFGHEELPDLVNYALFSTVANPTTSPAPNGECSSCTKQSTCGRSSKKTFSKIYIAMLQGRKGPIRTLLSHRTIAFPLHW